MHRDLFDKLSALPPLNPANRQTCACKICGGNSTIFDVADFNKCCSPEFYEYGTSGIEVSYYRCDVCGFAFTRLFDDWTPQDFTRFIYNGDYVKVDHEYADSRPRRMAATAARRLAGQPHLRILDYGSGSGLFADQMRSRGFANVSSYDPFTSPDRPNGRFDVVTCHEVLEHTISPLATMLDIAGFLDPGGCLFFGTSVQPQNFGELRANWWYVGPRNGHVSIYSLHSLARLGQSVGLLLHEGPGGLAFAGSGTSSISRKLLAAVGPAIQFFRLMAPGPGEAVAPEQAASWQPLEPDGAGFAPFRWSCEREIPWRVQPQPFQPGVLQFEIPFRIEIRPGFAAACRLRVGRRKVAVVRDAGLLTVRLPITRPVDALVKLVTPSPLRPSELGLNADRRLLGLAIGTRVAPPDGVGDAPLSKPQRQL